MIDRRIPGSGACLEQALLRPVAPHTARAPDSPIRTTDHDRADRRDDGDDPDARSRSRYELDETETDGGPGPSRRMTGCLASSPSASSTAASRRRHGVTAIDKRPVDGRVADRPLRRARGRPGRSQAPWRARQGAVRLRRRGCRVLGGRARPRSSPPGFFGENLRTEGIDVNAARIGELWRIGETVHRRGDDAADAVPDLRAVGGRRRSARAGSSASRRERRLGPYLRVLRNGFVQAGRSDRGLSRPEGAPGLLDAYIDPA